MKKATKTIKIAAPQVAPAAAVKPPKSKPAKAAAKPAVAAAAPAPKIEPSTDRRITPGARIETWRVVVSQRAQYKGWWLQAGHFEQQGDRQLFRVAQQQLFADLAQAKAALAAKLPKPAAA